MEDSLTAWDGGVEGVASWQREKFVVLYPRVT